MAERRMFARQIVCSDAFLDMPASARALYYQIGMEADDDGFCGAPKRVMRECGASEDDLRLLLAKRYLLSFASGVVCVKAWKVNNYIQKDRYKGTSYKEELATLTTNEYGAYTECIQDGYNLDTDCIHRLGKDRLGKDRVEEERARTREGPPPPPPKKDEVLAYCREIGYNGGERFYAYYAQKGFPETWKATAQRWRDEDKAKATNPAGAGSFDPEEAWERKINETYGGETK